jgi:hypothetical protein
MHIVSDAAHAMRIALLSNTCMAPPWQDLRVG